MMIVVRQWYSGRSAREQKMILLMLAIALPLLVSLAIVQPVSRAYEAALERHLVAVDRNGRIRALADRPKRSVPEAQFGGGDLALIVTDSAAQAGLTVETTTPSGADSVTVGMSQAPPTAVTQWLGSFEQRGIRVDDVRITPAGANSVSVSARLTRARR